MSKLHNQFGVAMADGFTAIPNLVLDLLIKEEVSYGAQTMIFHLFRHLNGKSSIAIKHATLLRKLGLAETSENALRRWIKELVSKELLIVERGSTSGANIYNFSPMLEKTIEPHILFESSHKLSEVDEQNVSESEQNVEPYSFKNFSLKNSTEIHKLTEMNKIDAQDANHDSSRHLNESENELHTTLPCRLLTEENQTLHHWVNFMDETLRPLTFIDRNRKMISLADRAPLIDFALKNKFGDYVDANTIEWMAVAFQCAKKGYATRNLPFVLHNPEGMVIRCFEIGFHFYRYAYNNRNVSMDAIREQIMESFWTTWDQQRVKREMLMD